MLVYTGTAGSSSATNTTDDEELQEAIRRSLNDTNSPHSTTDGTSEGRYSPPPPYNPAFSGEAGTRHNMQGESNEISMEDLRTARLRKFTRSVD